MDNVALSYQDERQYETINGLEYMMARPSVNHWRISHDIVDIFDKYLDGKVCEAFGEIDVFLDEETNVIPDAMIVCNQHIIEENAIYGVPDLIVEILSKSTARRDKIDKLKLYEKFGVKEYWIVDPFIKCVDVYILKDNKLVHDDTYQYVTNKEYESMTDKEKAGIVTDIKVSLYDDFIINVKDIFKRVK